MQCVHASPQSVGRERQNTGYAPHPVIGNTAAEKGAVATIVLNHEYADHKACGGNRDDQRQQIIYIDQAPHDHQQRGKWNDGHHDLLDRSHSIGLPIEQQASDQIPRVWI